jgi:hypothetical protein
MKYYSQRVLQKQEKCVFCSPRFMEAFFGIEKKKGGEMREICFSIS